MTTICEAPRRTGDEGDIQRIAAPTVREFQRAFLRKRKPVIVEGLMHRWPALSRWSTEYLAEQMGDTELQVAVASDKVFKPDQATGFAGSFYEPMTFAQLAERWKHDERQYYLQQQSLYVFPSLLEDIQFPPLLPRQRLRHVNLWAGRDGHVSPLHYDVMLHNLLGQVCGRKRVVLFAPSDLPYLYPHSSHSPIPHLSRVDIDHPDPQQFPLFARARRFECVIEPGELLFIPNFWWHQVYSQETNVSVNFWWRAPARQMATAPGRRLLVRRDAAATVVRFFKRRLLKPLRRARLAGRA